jgi:hypothetical protein
VSSCVVAYFNTTSLTAENPFRLVASTGALLTIMTIAINPFVQQIISYEARLVNVTEASIPVAINYNTTGQVGGSLEADLTIKAAIMNAVLNIDATSSLFDVRPDCATGNCTWPPYQTLAVCSACNDLTKELTTKSANLKNSDKTPIPGTNSSLPNGLFLVAEEWRSSQGLVTMTLNNSANTDGLGSPESIAFSDPNPFLDVFAIVAPYNSHSSGKIIKSLLTIKLLKYIKIY